MNRIGGVAAVAVACSIVFLFLIFTGRAGPSTRRKLAWAYLAVLSAFLMALILC